MKPWEQKLRLLAANHGRTIQAEAREILARSVAEENPANPQSGSPQERMRQTLDSLSGIWKGRGNTDAMMRELRGED